MRIVSFSKKWGKLHLELPIEERPEFTTFRFPRKDRDMEVGERVQVYFKNRTPQREKLGEAIIINKEMRKIATAYEPYRPTEEEAIADGFTSLFEMNVWFREVHGNRIFEEPVNKLTLKWITPSD